jgi:hypothetical protein
MRNLTLDDFSGKAGTSYELLIDGGAVPMTLAQVQALPDSGRDGGAFRLEFVGPRDPILAQAIYPFREGEEQVEIFIVPIGRDESGTHYEAIFF